MRNYFLIIGSTSYFDDYLSKIDVEKDSFIELVRQDDTQRKGGVITWDPSPNLVVRNSDYHGLVASAHDRLGELIKEFTTEDAYIYIHNPPAALVRQLMAQYELGDIVVKKKNEEYDINRDPKAFAAGISEIQKKIIGQETAIKDISKSIWYLTKVNRKKPYVVMLYGNSSLGKTQLVREIAKSFFKSKYMEKHLSMFKNGNYAEYFFGNEPNRSSIGFELLERESNLVFLDEIDKCPEMFYSAFYTLFDNTVFKDYTYDVDISGVLIILTANYTSMEEMKTALGLPIFYRIDKFIHFDDFSKENILSAAKTNPEGSYATAQEMEEQGVRKGETLLEDGTAFTLGKAGNAVRKPLTCERKPNGCPPQNEVHDEPYPFEGMHSPTVICIVQRIRAGTLWIVRDNGPRPKVAAQ